MLDRNEIVVTIEQEHIGQEGDDRMVLTCLPRESQVARLT